LNHFTVPIAIVSFPFMEDAFRGTCVPIGRFWRNT
jgi:hypothetical protein